MTTRPFWNTSKEIMRRFGVSCETAENGEKALGLVERNGSYDIYFVDWKMPGMDGITLTKALKAKESEPGGTIVIMISSVEMSEIENEAKIAGVDKFLSKPLFPLTIADIINDSLGLMEQQTSHKNDITGLFKGRRILLTEDIEINREIVLELLEPTHLIILTAPKTARRRFVCSAKPLKITK